MKIGNYHCPACKRAYAADRPLWRCECGSHLNLGPGGEFGRGAIVAGEASLWRYAEALALSGPPRVSLGEGWTPLLQIDWDGARIHFKLESQMPTGSFKDRGTVVMLNHLLEIGVGAIHEDSSGNAGASIATYAAAAGIACRIYVPASAPRAKLVQIAAAGADVRPIPGTRQDVTEAALAAVGESFYASHNWHPFFLQGTKTLAYELWEDLGFRAPDNIITPCGAGSNVLGCEIGFSELLRVGEIDAMPRIFAAQPANCGPIAAAFLGEGAPEIKPTIAEGTAIAQPIRMIEVLGTLRETRGGAVMLSEEEIAAATLDLARIGIYVEPTSAQAAAAFRKLRAAGAITPEQTTVLVLTGSGLKATPRIAELLSVEL